MLIFIGVLFTCVIPLFLYVNKVNSVYDQVAVEMGRLDEDRRREQIDVYAYPVSEQSDSLNVYIKNRAPFMVKAVRVWVNDQPFNLSISIPAMNYTIESIDVHDMLPVNPGDCRSFNVKVTTARGNGFSSLTNPLYYTAGEGGGWSGGVGFTIQVVIQVENPQGTRFFHVEVAGPSGFLYEADVVKRTKESSCFVMVPIAIMGDYYVTVMEGDAYILEDKLVTIDMSNPSQLVYAYA